MSSRNGGTRHDKERGALKRRDEINHSLTHLCVRKLSDCSLHVVLKVARLVGRRNGAGDGRMRDDPFQKELRPGSAIEFGRPIGQLFRARAGEQITATEWTIDDHSD